MYNFEPYNVLLVIATNIPVLLMTASLIQGQMGIFFIVERLKLYLIVKCTPITFILL